MRQSSPALSTTTWNHLPPEIHDRILYFFCLDIVTEYEDLGNDPFSDENVALIQQQPDNSVGGTCLGSLSSALRVSRYFYNSISHVIKFDGETAVTELKDMQFERVNMITEKFYPDYAESQIQHHWNVLFVRNSAGSFLKNPFVRQSYHVIKDILVNFRPATGEILIPRLEDWILFHAVNRVRDKYITIGFLESEDEILLFTLKCGDRSIFDRDRNPRLEIVSIAGVPSTREIRSVNSAFFMSLPGATNYRLFSGDEKELLIRDIKQSKPESWWLFRFRSDPSDWYLVNYGAGRMYSAYEDYKCGVCWNDSWDVYSWSKFWGIESDGMYSDEED